MPLIHHTHCCYCRRKFSDKVPYLKRTKDHFIAKSRTGYNSENILQCCLECNQFKAEKMPEVWMRQVEELHGRKHLVGNYVKVDYAQIIGSIRHWLKFFKTKTICDYKSKTII